jgi:xylitol oxidase
VVALEVVRAEGEIAHLTRDGDPETFNGAVVSLGALGAVTSLTLALQPAFQMRQDLYENLALSEAVGHFEEITTSADSVSLFTDWRSPGFEQVWLKRRVPDGDDFQVPPAFFGATRATVPIHPIRRMSAAACTEQLGVPGPWHERLPHFRMDHMPSSGDELQTEYLVSRAQAVRALLAIDSIRDRFSALVQIAEVRTIAADDLWMSMAFGRASVALHFTWLPDWEAVQQVLPALEDALAPFEPRPHWGKLSTMSAEDVQSRYPRLPEFRDLLSRFDPAGKFRNAFVRRYLDA